MFLQGVTTEVDLSQGVDNCGFYLDWNNINFESSLPAVKKLNLGNVTKILNTWLNAWITSLNLQCANSVYPCLFGCDACVGMLSHYLIFPKMMTICKFLDRNCSHHPISRLGIENPDKGVLIHMCCTYSWYHAVISHVKMNHDNFFY